MSRPESFGVPEYRARLVEDDVPFSAVLAQDGVRVDVAEPTPLIGTAVHASPRIRDELTPHLHAPESQRYREEDPETHRFCGLLTHTIMPRQSRFEVDLNRSPFEAVYETPDMSWGIQAFRDALPEVVLERSLEKWYEYHTAVDAAVEDAIRRFGRAVVFDLHSYNYQRDGPTDWRTDGKPVLNLGTKHLELDDEGRGLVDWFLQALESTTIGGEEVSVSENGVFYGGYLNRRLTRRFGPKCVTLSIEYKKVYMDEIEGVVHETILGELQDQMDATIREMADMLDAPVRSKRSVPPVD